MVCTKGNRLRILELSLVLVIVAQLFLASYASQGFALDEQLATLDQEQVYVLESDTDLPESEEETPIQAQVEDSITPLVEATFSVSTDSSSDVYSAFPACSRGLWSEPSVYSARMGTLALGTYVTYCKLTDDGPWCYTTNSEGQRVYFKEIINGFGLIPVPAKTATDTSKYSGYAKTTRGMWSAPSVQSKRVGTLSARSPVVYYLWTADGVWCTTTYKGQRVFIKGGDIAFPAQQTATDSVSSAVFVKTKRALWSAPTIFSSRKGTLNYGDYVSYFNWTEDGAWCYTSRNGQRVYFKGGDVVPVPRKTSTDTTKRKVVVNKARGIWSAPSIKSVRRGTLEQGSVITYRNWSKDGTWLYYTDAKGRLCFIKGGNLSKYTGPTFFGTYVDVNLSTQKLRYIDNGNVVLVSDVVTGKPSTPTPAGTFYILTKQSPSVLVGADYAAPVAFWMPFTSVGHGFHDANWQPWFGGDRWTYAGSHGCVNMPYWAAAELYGRVWVGSRVSIHW